MPVNKVSSELRIASLRALLKEKTPFLSTWAQLYPEQYVEVWSLLNGDKDRVIFLPEIDPLRPFSPVLDLLQTLGGGQLALSKNVKKLHRKLFETYFAGKPIQREDRLILLPESLETERLMLLSELKTLMASLGRAHGPWLLILPRLETLPQGTRRLLEVLEEDGLPDGWGILLADKTMSQPEAFAAKMDWSTRRPEELFAAAKVLFQFLRFEDLPEILEHLVDHWESQQATSHPTYLRCLYYLGVCRMGLGQLSQAMDLLTRIDQIPRTAENRRELFSIHAAITEINLNRGNLDRAARSLRLLKSCADETLLPERLEVACFNLRISGNYGNHINYINERLESIGQMVDDLVANKMVMLAISLMLWYEYLSSRMQVYGPESYRELCERCARLSKVWGHPFFESEAYSLIGHLINKMPPRTSEPVPLQDRLSREATAWYSRGIRIRRQMLKGWSLSRVFNSAGYGFFLRGKFSLARSYFDRVIQDRGPNREIKETLMALVNLTYVHLCSFDLPQTLEYAQHVLYLAAKFGDIDMPFHTRREIYLLISLGFQMTGYPAKANEFLRDACREPVDSRPEITCLLILNLLQQVPFHQVTRRKSYLKAAFIALVKPSIPDIVCLTLYRILLPLVEPVQEGWARQRVLEQLAGLEPRFTHLKVKQLGGEAGGRSTARPGASARRFSVNAWLQEGQQMFLMFEQEKKIREIRFISALQSVILQVTNFPGMIRQITELISQSFNSDVILFFPAPGFAEDLTGHRPDPDFGFQFAQFDDGFLHRLGTLEEDRYYSHRQQILPPGLASIGVLAFQYQGYFFGNLLVMDYTQQEQALAPEDFQTLRVASIQIANAFALIFEKETLRVRREEMEREKLRVEATLADLKRAQSFLIQSEKLVSIASLISEVAMEINSPLTTIRTLAENLENVLAGLRDPLFADPSQGLEPAALRTVLAALPDSPQVLSTKEERDRIRHWRPILENRLPELSEWGAPLLALFDSETGGEALVDLLTRPESRQAVEIGHALQVIRQRSHSMAESASQAGRAVQALKTFVHKGQGASPEPFAVRSSLETVSVLFHRHFQQRVRLEWALPAELTVTAREDELSQAWALFFQFLLAGVKDLSQIRVWGQAEAAVTVVGLLGNGRPWTADDFHDFFDNERNLVGSRYALEKILDRNSAVLAFRSHSGFLGPCLEFSRQTGGVK